MEQFNLVEADFGSPNGKFYLLPVYLNFNKWDSEYNDLSTFLNNNSFENLVLFGDLNGRIGEEQQFSDNFLSTLNSDIQGSRKSKDKVLNTKGRKLLDLMESFGLIVLNGRLDNDIPGELTFLNANGQSVIDLALVSLSCLEFVRRFNVASQPGSDHFPIEVNFQFEVGTPVAEGRGTMCEASDVLTLLPKLRWTEGDNRFYQDRASVAITRAELSEGSQDNVNKITECINNAAHAKPSSSSNFKQVGKQKWFDQECILFRKRVFKALNIFRKTNSGEAKSKYLTEQRLFKKLCRDKKRLYHLQIIDDMSRVKDAKKCWDAIGFFKNNNKNSVGNISSNSWVDYFQTLLNPTVPDNCMQFAVPFTTDDYLDSNFTLNELKLVIANSKNNKAPGIDRIPFEFYKNAPDVLLNFILKVYNNIFTTGEIPDSFKVSIIYPLHKKGDINQVENYRGLSFIDCICKMFISLLNNRLQGWVKQQNILSEFQAGFRKGYSTIDNIFNLTSILNLRLAIKGEKVYCFFVDFSAAFDRIDRKALLYKLSCLGLSSKVLTLISNYYENTKAGVWCKEGVTHFFDTKVGLRQGCPFSPLMFALFVNDLPGVIGGGCNIDGVKVNMLLYADDIVILSPSSAGLQIMIKNLEAYCSLWNLKVNLNKSKIVVFRRGGKLRQQDKWWYKNERIEVVNSYKYLGVYFTSNLSWSLQLEEKSKTAKLAISCIWNRLIDSKQVPLNAKLVCFNAVVRALLCYGAEVWGCSEYNSVESVLKLFIKRLFKLPKNSPNYVLYLETGIEKIFFHTLITNMRYLSKINSLSNERLPKLLWGKIVSKSISWCKIWKNLGENCGVMIDFKNENSDLGNQMMSVVEQMRGRWYAECVGHAMTSQFHQHYLYLDLDLGGRSYLIDCLGMNNISWIMKARAGLLSLNFMPWYKDKNYLCSLCNLNENETAFHFIAVCPVLSCLRKKYLGGKRLSEAEFYSFLNGKDWRNLCLYLSKAWNYRWELIQEFNFV